MDRPGLRSQPSCILLHPCARDSDADVAGLRFEFLRRHDARNGDHVRPGTGVHIADLVHAVINTDCGASFGFKIAIDGPARAQSIHDGSIGLQEALSGIIRNQANPSLYPGWDTNVILRSISNTLSYSVLAQVRVLFVDTGYTLS